MAETFYPAYEWSVWFGTFQPGCSSFEYSEEHAEFDTTTQKDAGATSFGIGEYTCTVNFTCPVKVADEANYPDSGDRVTCEFISGAKVRTGSVGILSRRESLGGRGGKNYQYTGKFSGTVTGVTAGATS